MKKEYISPEIVLDAVIDVMHPLCMSTGGLPPLKESDDLGNLGGWN